MTNYDILKEYEAHKTPVPSYQEYKRLKEVERKKGKLVNVNYKIKQENQQLKKLLKTCKCEFEEITKFCNNEFEYARKLANNFHIPAEDLAVILQSTDNKELLTEIDNAIGEK